jgi:hypothetical protein
MGMNVLGVAVGRWSMDWLAEHVREPWLEARGGEMYERALEFWSLDGGY